MPLIECVPNFSEGRDAAVVDAIVAAMLAVGGVYLLAREMDADHNRAVVTLAGEAEAVAEAAVRGVGAAAARIDLRRHQGAHPRIGATDVVPFVPLSDADLEVCLRWAEWAGTEIWRRFQIPVYFYERSARRQERQQLEAVRRGQFEGLRALVRTDPERLPDVGPPFGEAALHPSAGATVVGARKFLIAFNVNLDTAEVEVARAIARGIRASSGGLPGLKAMGVRLAAPPRAQVSMNLTDFEVTSLATVWRAVQAEARNRGVQVLESELIGLVPRAAVEAAAAEMLQLVQFDSGRVVENRLATVIGAATAAETGAHAATLRPFLKALASAAAAPGGGAAAAAAAAMAAALGEKLARLAGAASTAAAEFWAAAAADMAAAAAALAQAVDDDSAAFLAVRDARRLPRSNAAQQAARRAAIEAATMGAAEVPLRVAGRCRQLEQQLHLYQQRAPARFASDLSTAQALAAAAFQGAHDNVAINLAALPASHPERQRLCQALAALALD